MNLSPLRLSRLLVLLLAVLSPGCGNKATRTGTVSGIVYYKNNTGLAMQFAACGAILHRKLLAEGTNRTIPTEWFASGKRISDVAGRQPYCQKTGNPASQWRGCSLDKPPSRKSFWSCLRIVYGPAHVGNGRQPAAHLGAAGLGC